MSGAPRYSGTVPAKKQSKIFSETKNRPYTIVRADYDHQAVGERT